MFTDGNFQIVNDSTAQDPQMKDYKDDVEIISLDKMAGGNYEDKPQIDLHEFLEQLGIQREEKHLEGDDTRESLTATDSSIKDYDELAAFAENNYNWYAMMENGDAWSCC